MRIQLAVLSLALSSVAFADEPKKKEEPKAPEMKPPQELTDLAKAMAGTWKCTGSSDFGGTKMEIKGTVTHKTDLDGYWISTALTGNAGKMTVHSAFLTTYDTDKKKFYRATANGRGGHGVAWGTLADKKISWDGEARWNGKDVKVRTTEDMSGKDVTIKSESSKDGGKTWAFEADITCKK
jgi:hypothetical protein